MRLIVLGSGNAEPHADRACAGYLLLLPAPVVLDLGPGAWRNLARAGVAGHEVRLVLLSHLHADHFSDLVPFLFHQHWSTKGAGRPALAIVGPPGTREAIGGLRRVIPRLDRHDFPIEVRDMDSGEFEFEGARIAPARVPHVDDLACVAWRVLAGGRTFVYSGDCRSDPRTATALAGSDLAVVEATFPDAHPHPSHLTLEEACLMAKEAGVRRLVLSHLSTHWQGRDPAAEGRGRFPGQIVAASDLLAIEA